MRMNVPVLLVGFTGVLYGQLTLSSPAAANGTFAADYTCDGAGSTLPLEWTNVPTGTKEFALLMSTIPPDGVVKWDWVLYNIPGSTNRLQKDAFHAGTLGTGSNGPGNQYNPPCSKGPGPKRYTWTIYALSQKPLIPAGTRRVTGDVLLGAMKDITLASASITMTHSRAPDAPGYSAECRMVMESVRASRQGTATVTCDSTYAYIGSDGLPLHPMMDGIVSSNLQVPIAQNFHGGNAWKIPLHPVLAEKPTSVVDGPIGVAVNGVPIFNPCTQGGCISGGDTKALGQLDLCNGHAGRADDYHYHAAPTCMMAQQPEPFWNTHPVGWALDGFAIFGYKDADGKTAERDDVCGGNKKQVPNAPQGYSYHLTDTSPYVMNCMAGVPSPDLANQASKFRPLRQPPVRPFRLSNMTLRLDPTDGYQVLEFKSGIRFDATGTGRDQYTHQPGTYKIRYKEITGQELVELLRMRPGRPATACWNFQFLDAAGKVVQNPIDYCR